VDYSKQFLAHEVDGRCLGELTPELLKEIGVSKVGHRLTILREVRQLLEASSEISKNPAGGLSLPPTANAVQGYNTFQETTQQLPVYMPQSQLSNYDVNCFSTNTHNGVKPQQYNQVPISTQPEADEGIHYYQKPAPQVDDTVVTEQNVPKQAVPETVPLVDCSTQHLEDSKAVHQEEMYNLNILDDFPNAQNLEDFPVPQNLQSYVRDNMMYQHEEAPNAQPISQQEQEVAEKPPSTEEHKICSPDVRGVGVDSPEIAEVEAPVVETNQQPRPFAWGNRVNAKIGPTLTNPSSKLLVSNGSTTKRLMKIPLRTPSQTKLQAQDSKARPVETNMEEAIVSNYGPVPQPGDIMKGTVKNKVASLGVFMDINVSDDALLTTNEGIKSFRMEQGKSYWVMVKKVDDPTTDGKVRIHLTSFLPGVRVQGILSHPYPNGPRQIGFFTNVGWYKPGLLLKKRMRDRNRKKNSQLSLFVLRHKLQVMRNTQIISELDLTEIRPQDWKPEDVYIWFESFYGLDERVPESLSQLGGKDLFLLTPPMLEQMGVGEQSKRDRILQCIKMMSEQRAYLTQRMKKQQSNKTYSQPQSKSRIPPPPSGDSHFPALGNKTRGKK